MEGDKNNRTGVMLLLMLLLLFWLLAPTTAKRLQTICVLKDYIQLDGSYYRPGDLIIGGNLPLAVVLQSIAPVFNTLNFHPWKVIISSNYQQFLALVFSVSEVNKDFILLPNITLGFHIYGHHQEEILISLNSLTMLSSRGQVVPGYKCDRKDILLSVIGGLNAKFSRLMDSIFSIFKVPQILPYLSNVQFNNSAGDDVSFSEEGLASARFDLLNWVLLPNRSFVPMKVGQVNLEAPPGQDFTINSDGIVWPTKTIPIARCGLKRCHAGERRRVPEGKPVCCYQCDACPEGTFSNQTESVPVTTINSLP